MRMLARSRPLVSLALAMSIGAAACGGSATQPPTAGSTPAPASQPTVTAAPPTQVVTPAPTVATTAGPLSSLAITTKPFTRIAATPLSMTAPDDGTDRLFIGNGNGQIWVVGKDGKVQDKPLVDLDNRIKSGGEQGLLGIAVHPAFPIDPRVFVDYTNNDGDTVVASLALDRSDPNRLDPDSFKVLLFIRQPFPNHNGGSLQFGADGYLTIAMGDGGGGGDPKGSGQDAKSLLGKILRIDVDGSSVDGKYGIPPENPFATGGGAAEVWISGMRNPWRTSFDRATGDFWIGDVGQGKWEEVDVVRAATKGAVNFGWNTTEGPDCYAKSTCDRNGLTAPVAAYDHDDGCAIVGGYVYRGSAHPFLVGTYLFSDNCTSTIWAIDATSDGPSEPVVVGQVDGNVASLGEDAAGELYVLTLQGYVMRLVATQG